MLIPMTKHIINKIINDRNKHLTKCPFLAAKWSGMLPVAVSKLLTNSSSDLKKTTYNILQVKGIGLDLT